MDGEEGGINSPWQTSCYRQGNIYRDTPVKRFSGKRGGSSVGSNSFRLYEFRGKLNEKTA